MQPTRILLASGGRPAQPPSARDARYQADQRDGASVLWAMTLPDDGPTGGFFRDGRPLPW